VSDCVARMLVVIFWIDTKLSQLTVVNHGTRYIHAARTLKSGVRPAVPRTLKSGFRHMRLCANRTRLDSATSFLAERYAPEQRTSQSHCYGAGVGTPYW
jgi:hypothetical protein